MPDVSLAEQIALMEPIDRAAYTARLSWLDTARSDQIIDVGPNAPPITLALAGRGWGKSRASVEAAWWRCYQNPDERMGIISPTGDDLTKVVMFGESGFQSKCPAEVLLGGTWDSAYHATRRELYFANGAMITGFSAEQPNRLRGHNLSSLVYDELAAYAQAQEVWDVSTFALRIGKRPIRIITTTPRPIPLLFKLVKMPGVRLLRGSTYDNLQNLAPSFRETILAYDGTNIGRQEVQGELFLDNDNQVFARAWLRLYAAAFPQRFEYLIASYDCAFSEKTQASETAWVVMGVFWNESNARYDALVVDAGSGRIPYPKLRAQVKVHYEETVYANRTLDTILIENASSGMALLADMSADGLPVAQYQPTASKLARAHAVSDLVYRGRVLFAQDPDRPGRVPPWAKTLVQQLVLFPSEDPDVHDDLVDAYTQCLTYLRHAGWLSHGVQRRPEEVDAMIEFERQQRAVAGPIYG